MIDAARSPIDEWGPASIVDGLGANEAHVWRASLDQPADVISKLAPLLSHDEYQRALRYYRPVDRDRFIVGRGILRKIVSAYIALPPGQLRFTYNKYGKPSVSDDQNDRALNFNLSHSAIKAKGVGISYPLDRFTVSPAPGEPPALLKVNDDKREVARWEMYGLSPGSGYTAALIAASPLITLKPRRRNERF